jgi:hypothetical protein
MQHRVHTSPSPSRRVVNMLPNRASPSGCTVANSHTVRSLVGSSLARPLASTVMPSCALMSWKNRPRRAFRSSTVPHSCNVRLAMYIAYVNLEKKARECDEEMTVTGVPLRRVSDVTDSAMHSSVSLSCAATGSSSSMMGASRSRARA